MPVLTAVDIQGIQRYIFASSKLRDVLAASFMVDHVTCRNSLKEAGLPKKIVTAAAGKAILEFRDKGAAQDWTARYTKWLLSKAPGLECVVAHREYTEGKLALALFALSVDLAQAKYRRIPSAPQLGLSVYAPCAITGMPASRLDQNRQELISLQIERLRGKVKEANERWHDFLAVARTHLAKGIQVEFPMDLDHLGRTHGESSLIGIVHIDGNGVGVRIHDWLKRRSKDGLSDDDTLRRQYAEWSEDITKLGDAVLKAVLNRIASRITEQSKHPRVSGTPEELSFFLTRAKDEKAFSLPIRPIVLGGDDLTFVCDGRIALDLAATALREFPRHAIRHLGEGDTSMKLTGCAGIALVGSREPFHRGAKLSESLCQEAKQARRTGVDGSWIDWHVGVIRPDETVAELRSRQYGQSDDNRKTEESEKGLATMRPYRISSAEQDQGSWGWLEGKILGPPDRVSNGDNTLRGIRYRESDAGKKISVPNSWSGSRRRTKRLAELARGAPGEIEQQMQAWRVVEAGLELPGGLDSDGRTPDRRTPLLDAAELLDLHLRLTDPRSERDDSHARDTGKERG